MAHYENAVLISEVIEAQILETFGDWHNSMTDTWKVIKVLDPYSKALLLTGVTGQQLVDTSYVPFVAIEGDLRMGLEAVFEALNLQTSQSEAHKLANQFRKGHRLSDVQLAAVMAIPRIARLTKKIDKWRADAKIVSEVVVQNLPKLTSVTDEEKAFAKVLSFDWSYSYSDDIRAWRAGRDCHRAVVERVKTSVAGNRDLEKVAVTVATFNQLGANFFFTAP